MNAVALLEKYLNDADALALVLSHSRLVAEKALKIADAFKPGAVDRQFIEEAALLHDIGVCRTASPRFGCHGTEPYIRHGIIGREILEREHLPRHALVCERHIGVGLTVADIRAQSLPLPERDMTPVTPEERIIAFADLFYSKKPGAVHIEKTPEEVWIDLSRFGAHKAEIFADWLCEFRCPPQRM